MTVTAELSKRDVPPVNPFLRGETLHYYWMSHFLSGALYRNVSAWGITAEQVVLFDGLAFGLAFVAFFYALARIAGADPWFASSIASPARPIRRRARRSTNPAIRSEYFRARLE